MKRLHGLALFSTAFFLFSTLAPVLAGSTGDGAASVSRAVSGLVLQRQRDVRALREDPAVERSALVGALFRQVNSVNGLPLAVAA